MAACIDGLVSKGFNPADMRWYVAHHTTFSSSMLIRPYMTRAFHVASNTTTRSTTQHHAAPRSITQRANTLSSLPLLVLLLSHPYIAKLYIRFYGEIEFVECGAKPLAILSGMVKRGVDEYPQRSSCLPFASSLPPPYPSLSFLTTMPGLPASCIASYMHKVLEPSGLFVLDSAESLPSTSGSSKLHAG